MKQKLTEDLFQAYYDARKNKRNKKDVIRFEMNYERNLLELAEEIWQNNYKPGPSTCFIVNKPVKREIFAASFRDRIVHHLIYNYINPIFERKFINDSYSCRIGKGTSYGIRRLDYFIRSCSENYQKDCYILKLDLKGYFMSINKEILFSKINQVLSGENKKAIWQNGKLEKIINDLIYKTIFHNSTQNFILKGNKKDWAGLPKTKSLFFAKPNTGLPIGNLTSQLFANIYLNDFDQFIKRNLKIKYYGRYVDDMVFVHQDKDYLKSIISVIKNYLKDNLKLKLHERKIYLQHYLKGVKFLGVFIKPYRMYIENRSKGNFYNKIRECNLLLKKQDNKLSKEQIKFAVSGINSYLGLLGHYQTCKLREKIINSISIYFWNYIYIQGGFFKIR